MGARAQEERGQGLEQKVRHLLRRRRVLVARGPVVVPLQGRWADRYAVGQVGREVGGLMGHEAVGLIGRLFRDEQLLTVDD